MSDSAICYLLVAVASIGLVVYGFMQVLNKQLASENDVQVLQRQIRGFAFLMLAQIVLVLGSALCTGLGFSFKDLSKAIRQ